MQFKVDSMLGRASGFNHIPSWTLVAKFGSTSCAWHGKGRNLCCFCLCGLSTEGLVLGWRGEHLKMRCETLTEGRQDIITELFCAEDDHGQKCPASGEESLHCGQTYQLVGSPQESPFTEYEENAVIEIGVNYFPVLQRRHQEDMNDLCDERRD